MKTVAILGIGKMGAAITKELIAAGHNVKIWNRTSNTAHELAKSIASHNLEIADSPKSALSSADFAICAFTDGKATEEVLFSDPTTLDSVNSNLIICEMGTSGVEKVRTINEKLLKKKIRFVDAPVSGSVVTVAAHQLLVMASGNSEDVASCSDLFQAFAKKTLYLGAAGAGQVMKLAVNLVVHELSAAVSESLAIATANGIEPKAAYEVFEESVIASPFVKYKKGAFLDPQTPVAMRIDTVAKDLRLIHELAAASGIGEAGLEAIQSVQAIYARAQSDGFAEADMSALFRFLAPRSRS